MKILAHRGYWQDKDDQNTLGSFEKALSAGHGIEVDIRQFAGELVVSHDIPKESCLLFETLLDSYLDLVPNKDLLLALNIKENGLDGLLFEILNKYKITSYVCFDMSIPDTILYKNKKLKYLSRLSELESDRELIGDSSGVLIDEFKSTWWNKETFSDLDGPLIFISSELHGRDHRPQWKKIKNLDLDQKIFLCTDLIAEAEAYFEK